MTEQPKQPLTYAASGIDLEARSRVVDRYKEVARGASRPEVLGSIGAFAGLFALGSKYRDPVIVSSTDGVGTKPRIAALMGAYESLGQDIVAACVNDALTTGAEPLFFLDYIGGCDLSPDAKVALVKGVSDACASIGCALLGGETADMPGTYPPGEFDLVGFITGVVERDAIIDGSSIAAGDLLFALPSNGLHTNGYSLVRPALRIAVDAANAATDRERLRRFEPELGESLAEALLRPHRFYVKELQPALGLIKGMAHITGGGIMENLPRILPAGLGARFQQGAWAVPPIFGFIQRAGSIDEAEMYRVFNMGLGMVLAISPTDAERLRELVPEALLVGEVVSLADGEPRVARI